MAAQDDEAPKTTTTDNPPAPEAAARPTETPSPSPVPVVEEPKGGEGEKVVQLKHGDFKKIKDEARSKGRSDALTELDTAAKEQGFESWSDALKALADLKKNPPQQAKTTTTPPQETTMPKQPDKKPTTPDKAEREANRLAEERSKMRKDLKVSERKRRDLQRQLDAKEAEKDLVLEMSQLGVQDVDYGMRLLARALEGKSVEEIAKFDRKAFFEKVRQEKPYLFGEKVVPATTGTNGTNTDGSNPNAQTPKETVVKETEKKQFDATKAKPEEVQARLRELGLNPHHV